MKVDKIAPGRSTPLRKNGDRIQKVILDGEYYDTMFLINGSSFITRKITNDDLLVKPYDCYMLINNGEEEAMVAYSEDLLEQEIIYDPYKYENSEKQNLTEDYFKEYYKVPEGYIDTLPKWYSFKFTYPDYNLIFIRPQLGISIQIHDQRNEFWEIIRGEPIILNGNQVHYFVKAETKFEIPIGTYHTVINPNPDAYVVLKERWSGSFDEKDIERVFNPNNYI
ncbi:MAG: hypothetical protein ACTSR8_01895 [Promethearchaeota archaeon]